jgi:gamma-tubulin complex component 3
MIENWMLDGDIDETQTEEFFVVARKNCRAEDMWESGYYINYAQVPNFFTKEKVEMIFTTGRAVNYIRTCCGEPMWTCNIDTASMESDYWQDQVHQITNAKLIQLLFQKFNLKMHFTAVRNYLFMVRGDFARDFL